MVRLGRQDIVAVIMVDYENVWAKGGLKGAEYLTENDLLFIFYSQCCGKIKAEYLEQIGQSKCNFQVCKLLKTGKNALDFYIATECGMQCQKGEKRIAIISNDKGFEAVADYFRTREDIANVTIVTAATIESGIMALNAADDAERLKLLRDKAKMLDIGQEYARLSERKAYHDRLVNALKGTEYEDIAEKVIKVMEGARELPKREIYTGALHNFGKAKGTAIYRLLKDVV